MSHTTHHDDCGCLTANYERRLDAQKEAVASLEAKVATLEAELAEIHVIEAKRALTCDGLRAHANALRDALEKADAAFNAWARDEDGIHPEAWPAVEHLREVLKATPPASLAAHSQEVWDRGWEEGRRFAATNLAAHDAEVLERAAVACETMTKDIVCPEECAAVIRALAAQEVTK